MQLLHRTLISATAVLLLSPLPAIGTDVEHGRKLARKFCAPCHVMDGTTNKAGPPLQGIIGRQAASIEGFRYSSAMRKAGADGLLWDRTALAEFLQSPKAKVPGNSMRFSGFWFQSEIDDLIAYLESLPQR